MTEKATSASRDERRAIGLAAVILLQALTALFFLGDVIFDLLQDGLIDDLHMWIEALASIALIGGIFFLMRELRRVMSRLSTLDRAMQAARGEMADVVEAFFGDWELTPSERDVGLMVLKGLDNDAIARIRGTAPGTVRAQCTAIYGKAGVDGRAQLISLFMEELLAGEANLHPA